MFVTGAGVDSWSPSWYVEPEGSCATWLREFATVASARGSMLVPGAIDGYRVGWFPSGLVFAEGHPDPEGLCPAGELLPRLGGLVAAMGELGLEVPARERPFRYLGPESEGSAGVRRCDSTVNLAGSAAEGLALLSGIAAVVRDSPGHGEVRFGSDRAVETVYLRGHGGRRALGRWYDKGLESLVAARGTLIRGEDQRRWPKEHRRDPVELTADYLRGKFRDRFLPLYNATKGVTVGGPMVIAGKLAEAVDAGDITPHRASAALGSLLLEKAAGRRVGHLRTQQRRRKELRGLGLVLGDGVLDEVEVDVHQVLEEALETDAWERRG